MAQALEVADIFRRHGEAFRQARAGRLGRIERRVMGAEMPGISGDDGKCLGRRAEQDRVNGGFVLERDLAERCRQCKDDMKVRHRQQLGLPIREPFCPGQSLALGTVTVAA